MRKSMAIAAVSGILLLGMVWELAAETDPPLPPGPNRELVEETCTPCHSAAMILQNHMSRSRWDETITWMQNQQGMEDLPPSVRNQILDYLAAVQGIESRGGKASPRTNRMYEYDYPPNPL